MAEKKNIATGLIGNALRSSAADHTTTFTDEVFDTERQKYQSEVNTDIESKIEEEAETRDLAINNEAQARNKNDQLLSQAIAAEQERAKAAEQANATAIDTAVTKNEKQDQKLSELESKVDDALYTETAIDSTGTRTGYLDSPTHYIADADYEILTFHVPQGRKIHVIGKIDKSCMAIFSNQPEAIGDNSFLGNIWLNSVNEETDIDVEVEVPKYTGQVYARVSKKKTLPMLVTLIDSINRIDKLEQKVDGIEDSVTSIEQKLDVVDGELFVKAESGKEDLELMGNIPSSVVYANGTISSVASSSYSLNYYKVKAGDKIHYNIRQALAHNFALLAFSPKIPELDDTANIIQLGTDVLQNFEADWVANSDGYLIYAPKSPTYAYIEKYLYNEVSRFSIIEERILEHIVYVTPNGSDETGDGTIGNPYATIFHANEMITDNSEKHRYIIKVADGTYTDLQVRYAGVSSSSYQGVVAKNFVTYEGNVLHPENVILKWDGSTGYSEPYDYDTMFFTKCLFHVVSEVETTIKGFTFDAKNTRYALHIETSGAGMGSKWEVSDCIFNWHGVPSRTNTPTIGTGSGFFEKGHLLRCKINNDIVNIDGWRNHDSNYPSSYDANRFKEGAEIVIESCDFGNSSILWRTLSTSNSYNGYNRCVIKNCIGIKTLSHSEASGVSNSWRVRVECSDIETNNFSEK